jgi:thiol-disulfide isomerase/thioredoxin
MKPFVFAWPLVALLSLQAVAQSPIYAQTPIAPQAATASPASMDPAALAILERAIATYRGVSSLSFKHTYISEGKLRFPTLLRYSREGKLQTGELQSVKLRTDSVRRGKKFTYLYDGSHIYDVAADQYRATPVRKTDAPTFWRAGTAGEIIGAMLTGKNHLADTQRSLSQLPAGDYRSDIIALGPQVLDGEMLVGIQETSFTRFDKKDKVGTRTQLRAWFGGTPFALRRMQVHTTHQGETFTLGERVTEQEFSPTFPEETFVFDDAGLTLEQQDDNAPMFDPRLKVGARPFPIVANDLQGRPLSLDKYKGKVVLLDFWATWCGPCVEGLPELQSAYKKYHSNGLEVVGISLDEEKRDLDAFLKKRKLPWPQVFDGKGWKSKVSTDYGLHAIPFLLLVGRDGKIVAVNPRGEVEAAVKAALAAG